MSKVISSKKFLLGLIIAALVALLAVAGYSSVLASADDEPDAQEATEQVEATEAVEEEAPAPEVEAVDTAQVVLTGPTDPYTSDEACLACHGGSYENNAANTAQYGIWNPHDSIHGGYNSCDNCHAVGQEITYNWCSNCHTYSAEGSDYYQESIFL